MGGVVPDGFDEGLVRDDGLLVDPPVQHRGAVHVRLGGEARRQPRLAHARLAGHHDDAGLPAGDPLPAAAQHAQRGLAADERALLTAREHGRERDRHRRRGRPVGRDRRRRLALQQQPVVQRGDVRRGRRAELVAQQHAQLVVDAQRLGDVAARRQQLHQHRVARLAVRLALDQAARGAVGGGQLARPEPQRRARQRLERVGVQPVERGPLLVDPAPGELRQQRPLEQRQRRLGPLRRAPRVAGRERRLGLGGGRERDVDVEPHVRQRQPQVRAALDRLGPERAPQPREQRGQPGVRRAGRALVPHDVDQLVPPHRPLAVEREVREQQPPLAARQVVLDPAPVDLDGQGATQLDASGHWLNRTVTALANPPKGVRPPEEG